MGAVGSLVASAGRLVKPHEGASIVPGEKSIWSRTSSSRAELFCKKSRSIPSVLGEIGCLLLSFFRLNALHVICKEMLDKFLGSIKFHFCFKSDLYGFSEFENCAEMLFVLSMLLRKRDLVGKWRKQFFTK